jgi:predicted O-methyltransferase YrrM
MTGKDIADATESVWGWCDGVVGGWRTYTYQERLHLAECALAVVPAGGMIVEVGSYGGLSTAVLLHVARERKARLAACDMFMWNGVEAEEKLRQVLCSFPDVQWRFYWTSSKLAQLVATSKPETHGVTCPPFVDHNIDFLHIDGDHLLAKDDCELWVPHIAPGGAAAFHDANPDQRAEIGCLVVRDAVAYTSGWEEIYWSKDENCLMVKRKPWKEDKWEEEARGRHDHD